ncbi:MAG: abortive infection family protein [Proteiniphilum sp.]
MANLSYKEKVIIEKFLEMQRGGVLYFSNSALKEFILDAVNLDIEDSIYHYKSGSRTNRLRKFFSVESEYTVGVLLNEFCEYWIAQDRLSFIDYSEQEKLYHECLEIAERLKQNSVAEHIDAIQPNVEDRDFDRLAKTIRESIEKNEPEIAIDRLHTFTFRYIRELCKKHDIEYSESESMNAVYGKYIRYLADSKQLESVMTERILKYSINIIEAFNTVRNDMSFAHDNPLLNYHESMLIFNNIANTIKFIEFIESRVPTYPTKYG